MAKQPVGVWGIDLGQCALKAIRLEEQGGQLVATAFDYVEHPKILSQPDADPDALTREALDKFLSRNHLKGDVVAISVPGQSGLARFVKLPPVEEKKIADIVRFEAKQQIPFNLEEVVWDYQKLGSGMVTDGFALDTEIGLFAMKRDMVNRSLQHFRDVNIEVHVVQMAPLALCNFLSYDLLKTGADAGEGEAGGKKSCVVALDIGADSTNLVITDGGRIIWQRPIPIGGNHFTRALTKDMKLTFAKAEHLKRNATKSPDLKKILASIKPVLSDFVSEVQRSLGYFTNTHRDAQIEYMVGLGNAFRLPGLQRFMSEKLSLDVRKLNAFDRMTGESVTGAAAFSENILSFAVAYGLAVQAAKQAKLLTNLLPPEIRVERLIKAKKPWAAAAAAALLLGLGGSVLGVGLEFGAYGANAYAEFEKPESSGTFVEALKAKKSTVDAISKAQNDFTTAKTNAEEERNGIASIVSGQKEQLNWLEFSKFLDEALPRPEDVFVEGLVPGALGRGSHDYRAAGRAAYDEWDKWRRGKATAKPIGEKDKEKNPMAAKGDDEPAGLDQLIQFNIEAVSSRYCLNLKNYWEVVKATKPFYLLADTDPTKTLPDDDKGWVIELRGFTYHDQKTLAVREVLMPRLAAAAQKKKGLWPFPEDKVGVTEPPPAAGGDGSAAATSPLSHVALLNSIHHPPGYAAGNDIITTTKLPPLVVAAAPQDPTQGGMGGMGPVVPSPGGMGNPLGGPGTGADDWVPVGSETLGATAAGGTPGTPGGPIVPGGVPGGPPGGKIGGGGVALPPPSFPPTGGVPMGGEQTPGGESITPVSQRYGRTEFVILLIWREKVEANDLFPAKKAPETTDSGMSPGFTPNPQPPAAPGNPET